MMQTRAPVLLLRVIEKSRGEYAVPMRVCTDFIIARATYLFARPRTDVFFFVTLSKESTASTHLNAGSLA